MKRVIAITALATLAISAGSPTAFAATKYKNCTALRKAYPSGVAKTRAAAKKSGAKYAPSVYAANSKMDRDKDGAACEV